MRGAWIGLNRLHRKDHLVRAILESVPYEYSNYLGIIRALQPSMIPAEVRVIGGGARSDKWNHIKASVLGIPYARLGREEFGCWGAALVAGQAVGLFSDLADAAAKSTPSRDWYQPDPVEHEVYSRMVQIYRESLAAFEGPSEALTRMQSDE